MDKMPLSRRESLKRGDFRNLRLSQTEREVHKANAIYPKINIHFQPFHAALPARETDRL